MQTSDINTAARLLEQFAAMRALAEGDQRRLNAAIDALLQEDPWTVDTAYRVHKYAHAAANYAEVIDKCLNDLDRVQLTRLAMSAPLLVRRLTAAEEQLRALQRELAVEAHDAIAVLVITDRLEGAEGDDLQHAFKQSLPRR